MSVTKERTHSENEHEDYESEILDQAELLAIREEIDKEKSKITKGKRRRTILSVFAKHGLLYLLKDATFLKLFTKKKRNESDNDKLRQIGKRLCTAFEELGPTFIKLGQVLVTRQDLLPEQITFELEKLLDEVPAIEFSKIQCVMEEELTEGTSTFASLDPEPLGSGSLAQTYNAKLKDGTTVAVKIVRPTVEKLFQTDITIIKKITSKLQKRLPTELSTALDLHSLVDDYYSSAMDEINMVTESRKMSEFQTYEKVMDYVAVPKVFDATKNILIMEYIDGWLIKDFPVDFYSFEERVDIMIELVHLYVQMMLDGHYHADAHGSNIMIDKHTKKAVVIDWGMTGRMDSIMAQVIMRFIMHIQINQAEDAAEVVIELLSPSIYTDIVKLKDELKSLCIQFVNVNQGNERYNYGGLVLGAINIGMKNYCKVPSSLALWAKGFSATEGAARWICPEISYGKVVESYEVPIVKSILGKRFNFRANASMLAETSKLVTTLPRRANKIIENLADNKLNMNVQLHPDTISRNTLNQVINRLALTLITFALIIATGFIVSSVPDAVFFGIRVVTIGKIGMISSTLLVIFLFWRLFRTRKHRSWF